MALVAVKIVDPMNNKDSDVQLPDDAPMNQLVPQLLPKLGIQQQGSFQLQLKRTEKILGPAETLRDNGVQEGDVLRIVPASNAA